MIKVTGSTCTFDNCSRRPIYDIPDGKGTRCKQHKEDNMIHIIKRKTCNDCDKPAVYNEKGKRPLYCYVHKKDNMTNVKDSVCQEDKCMTSASYGKPGDILSCCAAHRKPGMIKRPNGRCKKCINPAIYGTNKTALHCEEHKTEDDENLAEKCCTSCNLTMILNKDNLCEYCDPTTFQSTKLAKQNLLMSYLDKRMLKGSSTDIIVNEGACGKERPDRVYELDDKIIIIECDENQHRDRACECEQTRMINIGEGYGGLPVYFIRWNPDPYSVTGSSNQLVEPISKRHKLLGDYLQDLLDNKMPLPIAHIAILYMYYDGWTGLSSESWKILSTFV
jgi:hypothetical protein